MENPLWPPIATIETNPPGVSKLGQSGGVAALCGHARICPHSAGQWFAGDRLGAMTSKNGYRGDSTARRQRSPDQALKDAREIVRRHRRGEALRPIAAALGLSKTTVERVIKDFRRAQAEAEHDVEQAAMLSKLLGGAHRARGVAVNADNVSISAVDAELDEMLTKYASGMKGHDARTAEDIKALNELEFWRMRHLPADHPAQQACMALFETGWTRPQPEHAHRVTRDDGRGWREGISDDW
jgi:hypothetical protein